MGVDNATCATRMKAHYRPRGSLPSPPPVVRYWITPVYRDALSVPRITVPLASGLTSSQPDEPQADNSQPPSPPRTNLESIPQDEHFEPPLDPVDRLELGIAEELRRLGDAQVVILMPETKKKRVAHDDDVNDARDSSLRRRSTLSLPPESEETHLEDFVLTEHNE